MDKYINTYGLLNATPEDIVAENCPLFTQEYLMLTKDLGDPARIVLQHKLNKYIDLCKVTSGLYNNLPFPDIVHEEDQYCSPDQLIAYLANLKDRGDKTQINAIYKYLKSHWFTYDNVMAKTNFRRIMQPGAVLFAGVLSGKTWLRPLLSLVIIISCLPRKGTSGELKSWVMMNTANLKITKSICNYIITREYGSWERVFKIYFPLTDHPIHRIAHHADS